MPVPRWVAHLNKRFPLFNKRELARGRRPYLTHIGRSSGTAYRTPLDAHPVDDGYLFILMYGAESDWVQNILAAGRATLTVDGTHIELRSPRLVDDTEGRHHLPDSVKAPPKFLNVTEYLLMETQAAAVS